MHINDIPLMIQIEGVERKIHECAARGLQVAMSAEEVVELATRMTDMYSLLNTSARMSAIISMYGRVDGERAAEMGHELAALICGFLVDPNFTEDARDALHDETSEIERRRVNEPVTTTTYAPAEQGVAPDSNVTQVDFVSKRRK